MKKANEPAQGEKPSPAHSCVRIDNAEGDWQAYLRVQNTIEPTVINGLDEALPARRRCALAYLGKRAQSKGGIYSKSTPRVLTAQFILSLAAENCAQRFKRYPSLERLIKLVAEIENMHDEIAQENKVLPFSRTPQ